MTTVIRVENKFGTGMFSSGDFGGELLSVYEIEELYTLAERHRDFPNFYKDNTLRAKLININPEQYTCYGETHFDYRFAFKNLDMFEAWVLRSEVKSLKANGFKVYKITAKEVVSSEYQSLFNINSVVSKEDITDLFLN